MNSTEFLKKKGLITSHNKKFIINGNFGTIILNDLLDEFLGISLLETSKEIRKIINKFPKEKLFCFECEIETLLKNKKGVIYCTNCGLIH